MIGAVSDNRQELLHRVRALPDRPGVYMFKDAKGKVIYVGKAARLRERVRSYFGSPRSLEPKVRALAAQIADLEYIVTRTAAEALVLEASLVKRHQPFFNVRLKDDKHYPYLKIDLSDPWPRVEIARRVLPDGARYFGPYASAGSVRKALDLVKKLFPWRSCTKVITGTDPRPCLEYYIHRCLGPCASLCTKEEYDRVIRQTIKFLEGRTDEVVADLWQQMEEAAENLEFERAAHLRDQIRAIQRMGERQAVDLGRYVDMDVFGLAREGPDACVQVFFVRGGNVIGRDHFALDGAQDEPEAAVLASFLSQFYEAATYVPEQVLLPVPVEDQPLLEAWLSERRGGPVRLLVPEGGQEAALVEMARDNAREALQALRVRVLSQRGALRQALEELAEELDLPGPPRRIECYDISNIQGAHAVGSMVVFVDGQPRPAEYRRFRIKFVSGPNDFAMLQEVLRRRFRRARDAASRGESDESFAKLPDLLMVDGGKGQVSAAHDVMRDMGLGHIPLVGLAKRFEELYVVDLAEPIVLPRTSQALYLVQRIRDEAHRFAITYHRKVRDKAGMESVLDSIPGIGPKRKKALLRKFGSLQGIREAPLDEIAATPGFTRALARRVLESI
ncbi:UvrABC system protein C [bacterium HR24]|nr:UvrABC system protein C [bacterium HR24]